LAGECELPVVIQLLVAENENRVAIDRIRDPADGLGIERPAGIDPRHFAGEQCMQRANLQLQPNHLLQRGRVLRDARSQSF
jgi:hypothetical protein